MKFVVFLIFLFSSIGFSQYLRLNSNPEVPHRMPDPETEIGIILSQDSPVLSVGGGGGKISKGRLSAGTLVIANRINGNANWIAVCGNTIHTPWKPRGKIVYFKEEGSYQLECENMLTRLDRLQNGVDELLARDYTGTLLELRQMIKNLQPAPRQELDHSSIMDFGWTNSKTIAVPIGTVGGFFAGGYGFPEKVENKEIVITSGVGFWTAEGTRQQTPDKINVITHTSKKFSYKNAAIGALAGFLSSYLIFSF